VSRNRFHHWKYPEFDERGMTKWNWMVQNGENLKLGKNSDIGAFTYINAKFGVEIQDEVQIGSHCAIYSWSTIDNKRGRVIIKRNARIGSHSIIMPGVSVGEDAVVGAFSFVNKDVKSRSLAFGIPVKTVRKVRPKVK
jgi:acetyltransferase-like isoleucine patch superfamily enzyme